MTRMLLGAALLAMVWAAASGCGSDNGAAAINHAPAIRSCTADPDTIHAGQLTQLCVLAIDRDGDPLSYDWETVGAPVLLSRTGPNTAELTNAGPVNRALFARVTAVVTDGRGGEARESLEICILP